MATKPKAETKPAPKKAPEKKAPAKVEKKPAEKKTTEKKPVAKAWKPAPVTTKAALIEELRNSTAGELSAKAANELIDNLFAILAASIRKNERFSVPGFGTFNVRKRKARVGRNPQTNAQIKIKASKSISFKATPKLRETL